MSPRWSYFRLSVPCESRYQFESRHLDITVDTVPRPCCRNPPRLARPELTSFPRAAVLQAAINATSLALISAGLPLSDYVCSLSLASYPSIPPLGPPQIPPFDLVTPAAAHTNSNDPTRTGGSGSTTILDLLAAEETALPNLTIAVLPRSGKVSLINLETRLGVNRFEELLKWGVEGSKVVQAAMQEAVENWATSLAAPRGTLGTLFPASGALKGAGEEDDEMV